MGLQSGSEVLHQVAPPYTPQLNGVAGRVNRAAVESAQQSQVYGKKVSLELRGLVVLFAAYVQYTVISKTGKVTPFQLWYGKETDVSHLRTFG